jgi:L-Ala-D/L-Glu epimerase
MSKSSPGRLSMRAEIEKWPLKVPFRITGHTWEFVEVLLVTLEQDGRTGRGEAAGVYYRNDIPSAMLGQVRSLATRVEAGIDRDSLQRLLPPGGARNALDCALWDLEARLAGRAAWEIAKLEPPQPLLTTYTCGAESPETMAATARAYSGARAIKIKLTGDVIDAERVRAVRAACPGAWLGVDANQGFTRPLLESLMPALVDACVDLIEQPFPVGHEPLLDGFRSPIPIAADESAQSLDDLPSLVGRFQIVNIKLDKCGGLTEGLAIARAARAYGLDAMVGNMLGTSLAMAPAYLVGQLCLVVDLDGPILLKADRQNPARYSEGTIACPSELWG